MAVLTGPRTSALALARPCPNVPALIFRTRPASKMRTARSILLSVTCAVLVNRMMILSLRDVEFRSPRLF